MALRLSVALANHLLQNGSLKNALQNGIIQVYSGSQPTTPDAAPTGTLLCTYTNNSGAFTAEVRATGTVTLSTGAAGSVDTVTVNGVNILPYSVPFNTSLTQTATDVATAINRGQSAPDYTASASGAVVTITALRGVGTAANGFVVSGTFTTITGSYANMSGGVNAANGLQFDVVSGGTISKLSTQTWSGVAAASGTAGWFRFLGSTADAGAVDSTAQFVRLDGSIATSGAQLNLTSTTIAAGATQTISAFAVTMPVA